MSAVNRETVRDALVTLFGSLVDDGIVQEVVGHRVSDPQGKTPIVAVLSDGTERIVFTFQGSRPVFHLVVQSLVLAEEATGYTAANAEDKLDLVEKSITDLVDANRRTTSWEDIRQEDRGQVLDVTIGGHAYLLETIPYAVKVHK